MDRQEALNNLRKGEDSKTRRMAAEFLVENEDFDEETIEAIANSIDDEDKGVRDACSRALTIAPEELKPRAAEIISRLIQSEDVELRNLVGDTLMKIGEPAAQAALNYAFVEDTHVKQFAVDVIGQTGSAAAGIELIKLLDDENPNVVNATIEALGNLEIEDAVETLISIYGRNEEINPTIIEALGKIGGADVEAFLIDRMKNEKDIFMKVECIDALALVGSDMSVCKDILKEIPNTIEEIQPILLKTAAAIAFRQEQAIDLPDSMRPVARKALFEDDEDIRGAGLVALGETYYPDDTPALVNETLKNVTDTQSLILNNLLCNSSRETIEKFFDEYCAKCERDFQHVEFISLIDYFYDEAPYKNIQTAFNSLMQKVIDEKEILIQEVSETLINIDRNLVAKFLEQKIESAEEQKALNILDIISTNFLIETKEKLKDLAAQENELGRKAGEVLSSFENE